MRRQRFLWQVSVIAILLITYGGFFVFYQYGKNQAIWISSIVALSIGIVLLVVIFVAFYRKMKKTVKKETLIVPEEKKAETEEKQPEVKEKPAEVQEEKQVKPVTPRRQAKPRSYYETSSQPRSYYDSENGYVKEIGHGPILEINGHIVRDMRTNTFYRLEGNNIYVEGGGLAYVIYGDRIQSIRGHLLYEKSGNSINKVFGGFFASISGNYITQYDSSRKFEITAQFSSKMILLITVLAFGEPR